MSKGLSRVLDIIQASIQPREENKAVEQKSQASSEV